MAAILKFSFLTGYMTRKALAKLKRKHCSVNVLSLLSLLSQLYLFRELRSYDMETNFHAIATNFFLLQSQKICFRVPEALHLASCP